MRIAAICVAVMVLGASSTKAATITFSELPTQPVDGLTFMDVTFDFKVGGVDSTAASFGGFGPVTTTYVTDPSLEGDSNGILTLDFGSAVAGLQFGVALSTTATLTPGFSVELFDATLTSLGTIGINTSPLPFFSEGLFSYSGTPVSRAIIDFNFDGGRFALDNLTTRAATAPEPSSMLLLGFAAASLARPLRRLRRRSGRA